MHFTLPKMCRFRYEERSKKSYVEWRKWVLSQRYKSQPNGVQVWSWYQKPSGASRICVDLKPLDVSVMREVHPIPNVDESLAKLSGAQIFSKLDANSGFRQIPLAKESRPLTTFITPFGRYCFNKLPFGISSAPELFQRRMNEILDG